MYFLSKILNIGVDSNSGEERKRIRILNGIAFFSTLILIFNGVMIFIGSYPFEKFTLSELSAFLMSGAENIVKEAEHFRIVFPIMDFGLAFFAFATLLLNYFRKQNISSALLCLIANFYIAFFYWLSGYFSVFFFFIPGLLPLILYQRTRQYLPFLISTMVIFIVLTTIKYNNGVNDLFLRPPADKALFNGILNFTAVFGILYFIVFHFKKENTKNEKALKEKNEILDKQSKEISLQHDELHKKNNELLASERELIESNKTKDKFITILAHDLKSPFNSLFGFSELLLNNFKEYDEKQIESQLESIYQTTKTTYELLEQILLWANSQSGKLAIYPVKFSFEEVTQELINEFKNQAAKKNISVNLYETEKIELIADLNMFKTVMRNLITNAIKFNNPGGQITILGALNDREATITVSDKGIGIAENVIPKLWEIKESYTTTGTENETGTGFGLKLCKELIDKQKGKIWVESKVGKGSDFKFTLPLTSE